MRRPTPSSAAVGRCSSLLLPAAVPDAQQRLLTLDDIYDPADAGQFQRQRAVRTHLDRRAPTTHGPDARSRGRELAAGGRRERIADAAVRRREDASGAGEAARRHRRRCAAAPRGRAALIFNDALHGGGRARSPTISMRIRSTMDRAVRLTTGSAGEEHVSFSPDGRLVAFVRDNNLYVADVATAARTPLTTDGTAKILNGRLDWVYQEEIYGRGEPRVLVESRFDAPRLSAASTTRRCRRYHGRRSHSVRAERRAVGLSEGRRSESDREARRRRASPAAPREWIDTSTATAGADLLIVARRLDARQPKVVYQVQNREQTWLDLNLADVADGDRRRRSSARPARPGSTPTMRRRRCG